jgi:hypothetical protein
MAFVLGNLIGFLIFKYSHALNLTIEMDQYQQLFDTLMRCRYASINNYKNKNRESKAASFFGTTENKAKLIHDFITS